MRIGLAQINPTIGAIRHNSALILDATRTAARDGAELVVAPELSISGYPPRDLLLREYFVDACDHAVATLAGQLPPGIGLLVGHPTRTGVPDGRVANAASLLFDGRIQSVIHKMLLPNYDVFDERRYFRAADDVQPIEFAGRLIGVHICEDAWFHARSTHYRLEPQRYRDPIELLVERGAELLINLSASPFEIDKPGRRLELFQQHVERHHVPFVFVNQVGGNDDLVFDGDSMVLDTAGRLVHQSPAFAVHTAVIDVDDANTSAQAPNTLRSPPRESRLLDALILGLRDYVSKCGFTDCVLGLSGGIDSALACYIAAQAVGPQHVHGLLMPSRYSSDHSVSDAQQLADALGIDAEIVSIDDVHRAYEQTAVMGSDLALQPGGLPEQNLQARIRGAMVMLRSNAHGWMALATGNKSELAVGYCTLYGDMAGGFAVLCDVFKRDVYAVARYINEVREQREIIPVGTLNKAPSAELAPNQTDQDTLPPYPVLDAILEGLIERESSLAGLAELYPEESIRWVANRLDRNEFKRRQMPPGIKVTSRAFGSGRRMPMAAKFEW